MCCVNMQSGIALPEATFAEASGQESSDRELPQMLSLHRASVGNLGTTWEQTLANIVQNRDA
jgi:hypothetical protein